MPRTKRHVAVSRKGVPLSVVLTAANRHDSAMMERLIDGIEPIKRPRGGPRKRPDELHTDERYDIPGCRSALRQRGIECRIARKGVESTERLGRHGWVVERTLARLAQYRRLTIRYERRVGLHPALLHPGCALIRLHYP